MQMQRYILGEIEESPLLELIKDAHQLKSNILPANLQKYNGKSIWAPLALLVPVLLLLGRAACFCNSFC